MMHQERIYDNGPVNYWRAIRMRRFLGATTQLSAFTCSEVLTAVAIIFWYSWIQCSVYRSMQVQMLRRRVLTQSTGYGSLRLHCRWSRCAPSNLWYLYRFIHSVISQKTRILIKTFRVSNGIAAVNLNLDTRRKGAVNLTPRSVCLRDRTRYPVNRRLVEPQSRSTGRLREQKNLWTYLNSNLGPSSAKRGRYINSW
jgi:hypothetical protein